MKCLNNSYFLLNKVIKLLLVSINILDSAESQNMLPRYDTIKLQLCTIKLKNFLNIVKISKAVRVSKDRIFSSLCANKTC